MAPRLALPGARPAPASPACCPPRPGPRLAPCRAGAGQDAPALPWKLMPRTVKEKDLAVDVAVTNAARVCGVDPRALRSDVEEVLKVVPGLRGRLLRLKPEIIFALTEDRTALVSKMVDLKDLMPGTDIGELLAQRPTLLLETEYRQIPMRLQKLQEVLGIDLAQTCDLVGQQPLFLIEDIELIVAELKRYELPLGRIYRLEIPG